MNTRLLRKVQKHILEEPKRVWMGEWKIVGKQNIKYWELSPPACGTVACISGWAAILNGKPEDAYSATDILELNRDEASRLFFEVHWPEHFHRAIASAPVQSPEYAKVVSDRIDHFIKTKGAE